MPARRPASRYQFERLGYFCVDPDSSPGQAGLQPHGGAARHLGQDRKARKRAATDDHSGIGGMLGDAASAVLKDGELVGRRRRIQAGAAAHRTGGGRGRTARALHRHLPGTGGRASPEQVDAVAIVRPDSRIRFPPEAARAVSRTAASWWWSITWRTPPRPTSLRPFDEATVLTLDRGGDFRCGSRWQARGTQMTLEQEQYFSRFAGRSLRPRHRAAGLRRQRGRAQGAVALGARRRPLPRPVPRDPVPVRCRPAHRPLLLQHRAAAATAASARGSTSAWAWRTATPIPEALRAHVAAGIQKAVEAAVIRMAGEGRNLCLAGGLGLNALLVSALENRSGYENVFVQPVAGNAGTAIGAVLEAWHGAYRQQQRVRARHALLWAPRTPRPKSSRCWRTASCASATC